jgi:colicin import membrane protein
VIVLTVLIVSFEFNHPMPVVENADKNMNVISAVAMMTSPTPTPAPTPPKEMPAPPKPSPPDVKQEEAMKQQQAKQQAIAAEKQKVIEQQKQQAIALKLQHKKKLAAQKNLFEKQLLEDLKKQTTSKPVTNKSLTKKELAQKQKNLEREMEKELREQTEKSRAAGAKVQGEVDKYKALILQAISRRWLVPPGVNKKLYSELLIRLAPGGVVLDVQVTKSSGDVSLDRSARDAVFKASPLPVPGDDLAFDQFRQFVLKVKPENVIMTDASI